jgi:hypothetical protein
MLASALETRVRTYLNEVTAHFYTQAEIWKWLSVAAKDISQKTLCCRRILTAATGGNNVRQVTTNAFKVRNVEYVPSTGRPKMLAKIDPLQIGHYPVTGATPQYWFEHKNIGIEPLPDAIYNLRLYVADVAKLKTTTDLDVNWTAGARWTLGDTAIHAGASSTLTYTAGISSGANYSFEFKVTGIGAGATLKIAAGTVEGSSVTVNGHHTQNIVANGTTLVLTGVGTLTIDNFTIYKEAAISAGTQEYELGGEWDHNLALYATYSGLIKDKLYVPAMMLMSIYGNEFEFIRQNIFEVIPDGRDAMVYK